MNEFYQEIMNLKEAEDIKNVVKRWETLSVNIKSIPTKNPIVLPDMLWIAKSGVGKTKILSLLADYLYNKQNLMEFYGDSKFFEFLLGYCPSNEPFSELQRLINEVGNASGFRNEFKGIIHIDIDEWVNHFEEKNFATFMEYLYSNSDHWLIVLSVSTDNKEKIHDLTAFISMYLRIEKVVLELPKTEDLFESIERNLSDYGLSLEDDAKMLVHKTVDKLRKSKYFDGFKTIKKLCQDIVYDTYCDEYVENYSLSAADLEAFSADSEYVKRMLTSYKKTNKIGFNG